MGSVITPGGAALGSATPQALGTAAAGNSTSAAHENHVHAMPTAAQVNALGLPLDWNASTNSPTLASGTPPTGDNCYRVSVAGSTALDGISTWSVDDLLYYNGTAWKRVTNLAVPLTTAMLKADGAGGITSAVAGVDYGAPLRLQCGIGMGIAPSGSIASNGALTLNTGIGTYSYGIWLQFPADAIFTGSAAGIYWVVMSSSTAGTVYNNTYVAGSTPFDIPASPTAFSGTSGNSYANATATEFTFAKFTIAANTLGKNGSIFARLAQRNNNSAGAKTTKVYLGASATGIVPAPTTTTNTNIEATTLNRGRADRQISFANDIQSGGFSQTNISIDTAQNQDVTLKLQIATNTDYNIIDNFTFIVSYAP